MIGELHVEPGRSCWPIGEDFDKECRINNAPLRVLQARVNWRFASFLVCCLTLAHFDLAIT